MPLISKPWCTCSSFFCREAPRSFITKNLAMKRASVSVKPLNSCSQKRQLKYSTCIPAWFSTLSLNVTVQVSRHSDTLVERSGRRMTSAPSGKAVDAPTIWAELCICRNIRTTPRAWFASGPSWWSLVYLPSVIPILELYYYYQHYFSSLLRQACLSKHTLFTLMASRLTVSFARIVRISDAGPNACVSIARESTINQ